MLISIQIPTYNQKAYICDAINSCLMQDYKPLQIIVADDCSNKYNIGEFLAGKSYGDTVNLNINENNLGRVKNYNHTLYNHVKGDYFLNLDGDDYYTDYTFITTASDILSRFEGHNPVVFEFGHNVEKIKEIVKTYIDIDDDTILIDGKLYFEHLNDINNYNHASCIFHTETAKKIGFYTQDCLSSDYNSTCKIYLHGSVIISSRKVATWRVHGNNATLLFGDSDVDKEWDSVLNILEYSKKLVSEKGYQKVKKALLFKIFVRKINIYSKVPFTWVQMSYIFNNSKITISYFKVILKYFFLKLK